MPAPSADATDSLRPLCVDLDGTLVKSDTLWDGVCRLARNQPLEFLKLPLWLPGGRAHVKAEVARRAPLDAARLPYNTSVLRYLQAQRREGRPIFLTTGADGSLAERVAAHLGLFQGILASDGKTNLTSKQKLASLQKSFQEFDYIGNSRADLPLLAHARNAMLANPTLGLRLAVGSNSLPIAQVFIDQRPPVRTLFRAIRVHQWAKNILLLAPLALSHRLNQHSIATAIAAFFCFSFIASANYLVNDLLDIESDRRHPSKRLRPFAAGDLPVAGGIALVFLLASASLAILPQLPIAFAFWLGIYIAGTLAYSLYLKRIPLVDVLVLSGLYTLRLLAGGAATGTEISQWLAGFSTFLFLSLAMVKRFSELENLRERGASGTHGRGYLVSDMEQIRTFGTSCATASAVVFMLYIGRPDVTDLYRHPTRLWLIVPLLIYWLYRVWLLASRGDLEDDPVVFAMRDPVSLALGVAVVALAIFAA
ncbi:MAG TPA: UbiA family prenyltransferase [Terracidiphilus sp.]|nr:UbiA family prenyltransferase [Terracidiphilus sp.]